MEPSTPVACTLDAGALAGRRAEWRRLAASALRESAEIPGGVRLTFDGGAGVAARLRGLVAAESVCCGFARWDVAESDGAVVLEAISQGGEVEAVRGMLGVLTS